MLHGTMTAYSPVLEPQRRPKHDLECPNLAALTGTHPSLGLARDFGGTLFSSYSVRGQANGNISAHLAVHGGPLPTIIQFQLGRKTDFVQRVVCM